MTKQLLRAMAAAIVALMFQGSFAHAAQITWDGSSDTNWDDAGNWDSGIPGGDDEAIIPDASTTPNDPTKTGTLTFDDGFLTLQTDSGTTTVTGYFRIADTTGEFPIESEPGALPAAFHLHRVHAFQQRRNTILDQRGNAIPAVPEKCVGLADNAGLRVHAHEQARERLTHLRPVVQPEDLGVFDDQRIGAGLGHRRRLDAGTHVGTGQGQCRVTPQGHGHTGL